MKKIKYIFSHSFLFLLFVFLISTSCDKESLEKTPISIVSTETVFATTQNAYAAINGMHRYLYRQWYSRQSEGGQSGNMIYMEVLGEDFVMTARANGWFISEYQWIAHRSATSAINRFNYGFYYALIANANQILAHIDGAVGPDADKNFLKAQALTYRAWSYYQMVQLYGKRYVQGGDNSGLGVSLITEPVDGAVPRSTVEDVYTQINADLDQAISFFANAASRPDASHLNIDVAKGIKARVALTQQKYDVAAQFAREARQGYPLMSQEEYLDGFSDFTNDEWMWGIHHRDDQPTYFYSFFAYLGDFSSTNTRGNPKAINSLLYDQISETDIRKQVWDPTGENPDFPVVDNGSRYPYMTKKFLLDNPGNSNGDLAFMRSAEMYLIEAEALARSGQDAEAASVLYDLAVNRDEEYTLSTNSGADLIEEIMIQRRVELWGEGFRFYDLKRLDLPLDRTGANHNATLAAKLEEPAGSKEWQFLIPQQEIDYTLGVVVQNPL